MCVLASTLKWPPGPWVGTGMGATREAVTGAVGERGSVTDGYEGILVCAWLRFPRSGIYDDVFDSLS